MRIGEGEEGEGEGGQWEGRWKLSELGACGSLNKGCHTPSYRADGHHGGGGGGGG